jgi:hypothetical protein
MQFDGFNYLMLADAVLHDDADLRRPPRVDEVCFLRRRWHATLHYARGSRING